MKKYVLAILLAYPIIANAWLAGYDYREQFNVNANNNSALTNYQIQLDIQGSDSGAAQYIDFAQINADGSDLYPTTSDGSTGISCWIAALDNTALTATMIIEQPSISAPNGDFVSYLYHGNTGATTPCSYDSAMSKREVDSHTQALYHLDGSGTTATDETGNYDGTLGDASMRVGDEDWNINPLAGDINGSPQTDDHFTTGDSIDTKPGATFYQFSIPTILHISPANFEIAGSFEPDVTYDSSLTDQKALWSIVNNYGPRLNFAGTYYAISATTDLGTWPETGFLDFGFQPNTSTASYATDEEVFQKCTRAWIECIDVYFDQGNGGKLTTDITHDGQVTATLVSNAFTSTSTKSWIQTYFGLGGMAHLINGEPSTNSGRQVDTPLSQRSKVFYPNATYYAHESNILDTFPASVGFVFTFSFDSTQSGTCTIYDIFNKYNRLTASGDATNDLVRVRTNTDCTLNAGFTVSGTSYSAKTSTNSWTAGQIYKAEIDCGPDSPTGGNCQWYINNVTDGSSVAVASMPQTAANGDKDFTLGALYTGANIFPGKIYSMYVYDYTNGAYLSKWRLDEQTGTTGHDSSNSYDLTITNSSAWGTATDGWPAVYGAKYDGSSYSNILEGEVTGMRVEDITPYWSKSVTPVSITHSGTTATITSYTAKWPTGATVVVSGATGGDGTYYNGTFTLSGSYPTWTYTMSGTPSSDASGTLVVRRNYEDRIIVLDQYLEDSTAGTAIADSSNSGFDFTATSASIWDTTPVYLDGARGYFDTDGTLNLEITTRGDAITCTTAKTSWASGTKWFLRFDGGYEGCFIRVDEDYTTNGVADYTNSHSRGFGSGTSDDLTFGCFMQNGSCVSNSETDFKIDELAISDMPASKFRAKAQMESRKIVGDPWVYQGPILTTYTDTSSMTWGDAVTTSDETAIRNWAEMALIDEGGGTITGIWHCREADRSGTEDGICAMQSIDYGATWSSCASNPIITDYIRPTFLMDENQTAVLESSNYWIYALDSATKQTIHKFHTTDICTVTPTDDGSVYVSTGLVSSVTISVTAGVATATKASSGLGTTFTTGDKIFVGTCTNFESANGVAYTITGTPDADSITFAHAAAGTQTNCVVAPFDGGNLGNVNVIKRGAGDYIMSIGSRPGTSGQAWTEGTATSTDGASWTKRYDLSPSMVAERGGTIGDPTFDLHDGIYYQLVCESPSTTVIPTGISYWTKTDLLADSTKNNDRSPFVQRSYLPGKEQLCDVWPITIGSDSYMTLNSLPWQPTTANPATLLYKAPNKTLYQTYLPEPTISGTSAVASCAADITACNPDWFDFNGGIWENIRGIQ